VTVVFNHEVHSRFRHSRSGEEHEVFLRLVFFLDWVLCCVVVGE